MQQRRHVSQQDLLHPGLSRCLHLLGFLLGIITPRKHLLELWGGRKDKASKDKKVLKCGRGPTPGGATLSRKLYVRPLQVGVGLTKGRLDLVDPKTRLAKGHLKLGLLSPKAVGFDLVTLALRTKLGILALKMLSPRAELGLFALLHHRMGGCHTKLIHLPLNS
jgi:hypothetical protein